MFSSYMKGGEGGGGHTEFWEASKFYKVWIDEGFQQVLGVFEKGFP